MSPSWSFGDLHTVSGLLAELGGGGGGGTYVQMGGLCWLYNLVISWQHGSEVPGLGYGNQGNVLLSESNRLSR